MAPTKSCKIAFIGSHGVGKTTLCYGLAARLKARDFALDVVHEVARRCPLPINEETGLASESWILHSQIAEEIVAQARYPVVICDRSALDNYVYMLLSAGPQESLDELVDWWMKTYDLLVEVPIAEDPSADGIRSEDPTFQRAVEDRLRWELERRNLQVLRLQADQRMRWLETVEKEACSLLSPAQLRLL
ncbi:MAG: ATP-binding protein [Acidobacteria bacterium]|nr:ATP-binding protein [Acidobacteriota bacterium]